MEQNMGQNEKKSYLNEIRKRYRKAQKELKTKILDEFCAICNYHRKHAIRLGHHLEELSPYQKSVEADQFTIKIILLNL